MKLTAAQSDWIGHLRDIIEFTKQEIRNAQGKQTLPELERSLLLLEQQYRDATEGLPN